MSLSKRTRRPVASRPSMARPSVPFTGTLTCYSVAFIDKPDLEFGDKVILPPKVLLEIQCLKIPLPLLFKMSVPASKTSSESYHYCGVLEFSAPAGQMYAPYWMMQQLGVDEGGTVHLESALSIPKGLFCQLQPDQMDFLDIAATVGPKVLLESAMRRYSCLSVDGCIVIQYGDQKYFLKVLQVKPTPVVHLFGDVDLEVDFKAPDNVDPRRPNSARPTGSHELCPSHSFNTAPAPTVGNNTSAATSYGRRLADGGFVSSTAPHSSSNPSSDASIPTTSVPRNLSLKAAQIKAKKQTEGLDPAKFKAIKAFATTGQSIAPPPSSPSLSSIALCAQDNQADHRSTALVPPTVPLPTSPGAPTLPSSSCPFCLADVPLAHVDLHMLRCKQHTAYHRFACTTCNAKVLQTDAQEHVHCHKCDFVGAADTVAMHTNEFHVSVRCTCGASMAADALSAHKFTACPHTFMPCALCSLSFQRHKFDAHYSVCSNRTQQCEVCNKYVNVVSYAQHCDQCADLPSVASHAKSSPNEMPCTNPCESPTSKDIISPVDDDNTATMYRCPYCTDATFPNMFALDRHTESRCPIAKSSLNGAKDAPILRGKLRRKADLQKPTAVSKAGGERIGQPKQSPPPRRRLVGTPSNNQQQTLPRTGSNELCGSHNNRMGETVLQGSTVGLHASKTSRLNQVESLIGRKPSSVARPTKR